MIKIIISILDKKLQLVINYHFSILMCTTINDLLQPFNVSINYNMIYYMII
jgi:hypothetical protein